jgi:ribosomal protein S14
MAVKYVPTSPPLIVSSGDDGMVGVWNLARPRRETPEWRESNNCELCGKAFFWNLSALVSSGVNELALRRQHHCRSCGRAVCADCSPNVASRPSLGFEFPVRVCIACFESDPPEDTSK